jgi:uracil-DNA glycosylase
MAAGEVKVGESWKAPLAAEFSSPYMADLRAFLLEQKEAGRRIFPKGVGVLPGP